MKRFIILISIILRISLGHAQNVCYTDEYFAQHRQKLPEIAIRQKIMDCWVDNLHNIAAKNSEDSGQVIIIPVVFHVIHNNGPENISDQLIKDEIARLNIDFSAQNSDTVNVRKIFKPLIANPKIQFRLATQNPWGQCVNGIDRVVSPLTDNAGEDIKPLSTWNTLQYLNIWVVHDINSSMLPPGEQIAGYSTFPWDAVVDPGNDGIVMNYLYIGKYWRVLSHEIGHYFGLYHTFQDSCSIDQHTQGDHCADTPPVSKANFGWNPGVNSCHSDTPDMPDMIENYMDYATYHYMFTPDQVWRIRAFAFERAQLVSQANINYTLNACASAVRQENGNEPPVFYIYPNPASTEIHLNIHNNFPQKYTINVFDISGKKISAIQDIDLPEGLQTITFTRAQLNIRRQGIYVIQIISGASASCSSVAFGE